MTINIWVALIGVVDLALICSIAFLIGREYENKFGFWRLQSESWKMCAAGWEKLAKDTHKLAKEAMIAAGIPVVESDGSMRVSVDSLK